MSGVQPDRSGARAAWTRSPPSSRTSTATSTRTRSSRCRSTAPPAWPRSACERAGYEVTERRRRHRRRRRCCDNGDGPTVMLRADMDALPVKEATGLPYASTATATDADGNEVPVMHACGHDMHVTWLAGATALLAAARDAWHGTAARRLPAGRGDRAGRAGDDRRRPVRPLPEARRHPRPARHARPRRATIGYRAGTTQAAADSLEVRLFGRGAHGSMPESSVDPVVMAAATVLRLQTIVSREIAASQAAVVTVGALQAGTKDNVIPDEALLKLNVRTFDEDVRSHVLDAIKRIVNAEAAASGAPKPPQITTTEHYPLTVNDPAATARVAAALRAQLRRRPRPRARRAGLGQRGLRLLRHRVGRPVGVLVRRRHRSRPYRAAEQAGRVADDIPTNHNPASPRSSTPRSRPASRPSTAAALDALTSGSATP